MTPDLYPRPTPHSPGAFPKLDVVERFDIEPSSRTQTEGVSQSTCRGSEEALEKEQGRCAKECGRGSN